MALHIRDFRKSDAAGLSSLGQAGHRVGNLPGPGSEARVLVALRDRTLTGAIWYSLTEEAGIITCVAAAHSKGWQSDVQELIVEASLWLSLRGAVQIDLLATPADEVLAARLTDIGFHADQRAGIMRRLLPAQNAA